MASTAPGSPVAAKPAAAPAVDPEVKAAADAEVVASRPRLSLGILKFIKVAHTRHGGDNVQHVAYRRHCSRRLTRARALTQMKQIFNNVKKRRVPVSLLSARRGNCCSLCLCDGMRI